MITLIIMQEKILKALEDMPLWVSIMLHIVETDYWLDLIQEDNPWATIEDIKLYNKKCDAREEWYKAAIEKIREWRNEQYLIFKNLK